MEIIKAGILNPTSGSIEVLDLNPAKDRKKAVL